MAIVSISKAAKLVRKGRQTLYNHNDKGKLSFTKTVDGKPGIDTSELERVYGKLYMPAESVKTIVEDNSGQSNNNGQPELLSADTKRPVESKLSKSVSLDEGSVSTVSWFIEQVDESKKELAQTKAELAAREQTLAELREAIAVLPSPESVERRLAEQATELESKHNEIMEAEREQSAQALAEQQERAARDSKRWQQTIADRKMEIQQARSEAEQSRQREADQAKLLKIERDRILALETRGLFARLLNKKPSTVG